MLYEIGNYGPLLLSLVSWYLLWEKSNLFFYYTVGVFISIILNLILKGIIKDPRPEFNKNNIKLLTLNASQYFFQNGVPFDIYGMPSGHAQMSFYITMFMYLSLKDTRILYSYGLFSLFICYQRIQTGQHTLIQVMVGSMVGMLVGYGIHYMTNIKLKGVIREKIDDFAYNR
jgi:membrane-associated phospholipid phosphatase